MRLDVNYCLNKIAKGQSTKGQWGPTPSKDDEPTDAELCRVRIAKKEKQCEKDCYERYSWWDVLWDWDIRKKCLKKCRCDHCHDVRRCEYLYNGPEDVPNDEWQDLMDQQWRQCRYRDNCRWNEEMPGPPPDPPDPPIQP